ncbi:GTPase HflX [Amphibacillus sp. MSJ-3]|uniref:GTPase HflX n=1 Tax=Amphibacillus sp. MSJ-3 TaxID=2841505 RepID=UPI001C0EB00D|nr:GTPase HflX [Amphibacillus sp. MSJ-3]MBU5595044.1 GTPase HflX [Amphibacillus sp. MSJ-3]
MKENVLIIAVQKKNDDDIRFHYSLDEIKSLTETAKGQVIEVITQKRDQPHPATYLGAGKIAEINQRIEDEEIQLIIANDELSASQMRNLQNQTGRSVIDRGQLILDIFANRATSNEGKLQVELAQYQYLLPRLHGQGLALSRLGGGIGTRGPGETKLESDRRHINRRINEIKRKLTTVVKQRDQYRKRRRLNHTFKIAIVGYTNAGKSTLFNRLTHSDSFEEDQLFATLDPMSRKLRLPSGLMSIITDTVGFMQDLPTELIAAFRSTLEEVTEADLIYHVVDASHPDYEQQQETVVNLLKELEADHIPMLTIYNKMDRVDVDFIPLLKPSIKVSVLDAEDRLRILDQTEKIIKDIWTHYERQIPADQGKLLQQYKQHSIITNEQFIEAEEVYQVEGYLPDDHPLL